jgi:MoaA/NifB/PqqE/SkfB family radical SAM enzyme
MCNIWSRPKPEIMTVEEVRTFFRANPGFSWVNLSGGEIFTRPDAPELVAAVVEEAKDLYLLDFPTTGQQTEKVVEGVKAALDRGVPRLLVTLSLDGAGEQHDEVRRIKGAYAKVLETWRRLAPMRRPGFGVFFGVTLSSFNRGALLSIVERVRQDEPSVTEDDFHVNLAQESAHYYGNTGLEPATAALLDDIDEFRRRRRSSLHPVAELERLYQKRLRSFVETGRSPIPCRALSSSLYIDPTWKVYPCTMWDRPLGDLRETGFSLAPFWRSPEADVVREEIAQGKCPHCWTPCEAYPSILGQILRPGAGPMPRPAAVDPPPGAVDV